MNKKINGLLSLIAIVSCSIPLTLSTTSCSSSKIVFANYESYLADNVIKKYQGDIQFLYYSSAEEIKQKFENSYDAAVPTSAETMTMMKEDLLAQIK
jgi:hypothetical protein